MCSCSAHRHDTLCLVLLQCFPIVRTFPLPPLPITIRLPLPTLPRHFQLSRPPAAFVCYSHCSIHRHLTLLPLSPRHFEQLDV